LKKFTIKSFLVQLAKAINKKKDMSSLLPKVIRPKKQIIQQKEEAIYDKSSNTISNQRSFS
jgi:hypothetical protein